MSHERDDKVGYGKPPKETRFKPGKSGNPSGRRKQEHSLRSIIERSLLAPMTVRDETGKRKITAVEGVIVRLRELAVVKGNRHAINDLLKLLREFGLTTRTHFGNLKADALTDLQLEALEQLLLTNGAGKQEG
jgi:hypothetical protein